MRHSDGYTPPRDRPRMFLPVLLLLLCVAAVTIGVGTLLSVFGKFVVSLFR